MNQLAVQREHRNDAEEKAIRRSLPDRKQMREDLRSLEMEYGADSIEVAYQLFEWGCDFIDAGRLGEAENLLKQSMNKIEKYTWPDYPAMATVTYFLGSLYLSFDRLDESQSMLLRALSVAEQVGSEELYWGIIGSIMDLAEAFISDDALAVAEGILFTVLSSTACHYLDSEGREIVSKAAERWTEVHQAMRRRAESTGDTDEKSLSPGVMSAKLIEFIIPMTLLKLARRCGLENKLEEAESHLQQALTILRVAPERNKAQLVRILMEQARVKAMLGKGKEAARASEEALFELNRSQQLDLQVQASVWAVHADYLDFRGRKDEAQKAMDMVKRLRDRIAGQEKQAWVRQIPCSADIESR
jgi:tetratricopeptide (TPR) repeat protein